MDLKGLEYTLAVAEAGSFTHAAEKMFVAQPSLSRKVAALEAEYNVTFFERSGRQVKLTPAGSAFCRWARRILSDCDGLQAEMARLGSEKHMLRALYYTNGSVPYVAAIVSAVRRESTEIEIIAQSVSTVAKLNGSSWSVMEKLRTRDADVVFTFLPLVKTGDCEWLTYQTIEKGGLCAFVAKGHPLMDGKPLTKRRLRDWTLILPPNRYDPELTDSMLAALGNPERVEYSEDTTDFKIRIIAEGYIGIMPASSRTIANEYLLCQPIGDVREGFDLVIAWRRDSRDPAMAKFVEICSKLTGE